jgi:phosphoribosylamine--glycine ligase
VVRERVLEPVLRGLSADGERYIGVLYCGLMWTDDGPCVIEFNARFGDPETQVVLPRLVTPLSGLLLAAATGVLGGLPHPEFSDDACVRVVLASVGYPDAPQTGRPISGLEAAEAVPGVRVLHAATARDGDRLLATGGRVLNVVARAADFADARARAYQALGSIGLEGSHYRTDIAARVSPAPQPPE